MSSYWLWLKHLNNTEIIIIQRLFNLQQILINKKRPANEPDVFVYIAVRN